MSVVLCSGGYYKQNKVSFNIYAILEIVFKRFEYAHFLLKYYAFHKAHIFLAVSKFRLSMWGKEV